MISALRDQPFSRALKLRLLPLTSWTVVALLSGVPVNAAVVTSSGTISILMTYATFGNGDVIVRLSSQPSTCANGYWLSPSQPGFKSNVAFLLAARAAGEVVHMGGDDTILWPGSAGPYCKLEYAGTPW